MVGTNNTIVAIRIVRSKLRKREEHSNSVRPADVVLQAPPQTQQCTPAQQEPVAFRQQPLWQFPPPLPPPYVYTNNQVIIFYLKSFCKGSRLSRERFRPPKRNSKVV